MENIDDTIAFMSVMPKEVMSRIYNINDYTKAVESYDIAHVKRLNVEIINLLKRLEKEGKIYKANNTYQSFPKNLVLT